jgi:NADPH:quinone reductase-like Zn-dependent oxidoreductase
MKAIPIRRATDAESLRVEEWPTPHAAAHEILIQVKAFGLNFADIVARKGQYNDAPKFPFVPGYEVSGIVSEVGSQVKDFKTGDEVLALTNFYGYAEFAVADERAAVKKPKSMGFADAASIPVNFLTAYHSLFETGTLMKNAQVLIHAGAGGVGLAAIQMAKNHGCTVFATAGSEKKLDLLREYGVDHPINYQTSDFEREVLRLNGGKKIDIVLDSVGGSYFKKDLAIIKPHGRVIGFGAAALSDRNIFSLPTLIPQVLSMLTLSMIDLMLNSKGFYGVNMLRVAKECPELLNQEMHNIMEMFAAKKLKTVISRQMSWHQIGEAHHLLESRASTGKIVLMVD